MLRVGLTGGIGSGKSTTADLFAALGVPVIDTDRIARELLAPGQPLLTEIYRIFGTELRRDDGSLDRAALRTRVFGDSTLRRRLEAITHPAIAVAMEQQVAALAADTPYVLIVIPLLLEAGWRDRVDRVLVVDCPETEQVQRVMARDGIDDAAAWRMVQSQASRDTRRQAADDRIDNSGPPDLRTLAEQVRRLDQQYRGMSA